MALIAENKSGDFELAPEGTHVARCYRIIDLGTQFSQFYNKSSHKIRLYWELPSEVMKDGKPFSISKQYTLSFHEKSQLRQMIESWRGRKFTGEEAARFDVSKILGHCCMVNIAHVSKNDNMYVEVMSVMALPKGMDCPPQVNPTFIFDLSSFDHTAFESLSDKQKEKIKQSTEYRAMQGKPVPVAASSADPMDDDIPW